jgi:hypothetical protein
VHAGDADAALPIDERSQKNRATHDGKIHFSRRLQFGIVGTYGWRVDDENRSGLTDLSGAMSNVDECAARAELANFLVLDGIGTSNTVSSVDQEVRQTAHSAAARADEINRGAAWRRVQQRTHLFWSQTAHHLKR